MNDFEELAHRAADAVRDTTAAVAVPELSPRRRPARLIALALAVVGVAIIGGILATRDDGGRTDVAGDGASTDPTASDWPVRLVWTDPGSDFEFSAVDLPLDIGGAAVNDFAVRTLLFGAGDDAEPFADDDLLLSTFETEPGSGTEFEGEPISVRGKDGFEDPLLGEFGFAGVVAWQETDAIAVVVASRTRTVDELVEFADTLEFDDTGLTRAEPADLDLLVDMDQLPFGATSYQQIGSVASLVDESQDRIAVLWAEPTTAAGTLPARYLSLNARPVTVHGVEGWLLSPGPPGQSYGGDTIVWETRGVLFTLATSANLDPVELAGQLVEIDEEQWAALVRETQARDEERAGETVAEGEFSIDGEAVTWRVGAHNGLCVIMMSGQEGSSSCAADSDEDIVFRTFDFPTSASSVVAYGRVDADVARIVIEGSDDMVAIRELTTAERVFGVVVPAEEVSGDLVAYAADGSEVWRRVLDGPPAEAPPEPEPAIELAGGTSELAEWTLFRQDGSLCLDVSLPSEGAGGCSGSDVIRLEIAGTVFIGGLAPPCVEVVLISADPEERHAELLETDGAFAYFASIAGGGSITVTMLDALDGLVTAFDLDQPPTRIAC